MIVMMTRKNVKMFLNKTWHKISMKKEDRRIDLLKKKKKNKVNIYLKKIKETIFVSD